MMTRIRHIIGVLFLVIFSFYAVSPLSYSEKPSGTLMEEQAQGFKNMRLFVWERLCALLTAQEDLADNADEIRFFIKKKRAILKPNSPDHNTQEYTAAEYYVPPFSLTALSIVIHETARFRSALSLHSSGLSPPSV